eukprot:TRINITY_DN1358_c1_g1_i5.p2 TRINITY_DN1358_c1_g1~~TRINITY_DN1358_c1_g1_i5.p2  ORF type:complete len:334 (+),score=124.17 TRINITY_DN1358_c1_g1_i5:77-1003(+)
MVGGTPDSGKRPAAGSPAELELRARKVEGQAFGLKCVASACGSGLSVTRVNEGTAAAAAGVETGMLLLEVNGARVTDMAGLKQALGAAPADFAMLVRRGSGPARRKRSRLEGSTGEQPAPGPAAHQAVQTPPPAPQQQQQQQQPPPTPEACPPTAPLPPTPTAGLVLISDTDHESVPKLIALPPGTAEVSIGRSTKSNTVKLDSFKYQAMISRRHAVLRRDARGAVVIEDVGSTNGFFVNDIKRRAWTLSDQDTVVFGGGGITGYNERVQDNSGGSRVIESDCVYRFLSDIHLPRTGCSGKSAQQAAP